MGEDTRDREVEWLVVECFVVDVGLMLDVSDINDREWSFVE